MEDIAKYHAVYFCDVLIWIFIDATHIIIIKSHGAIHILIDGCRTKQRARAATIVVCNLKAPFLAFLYLSPI